MNTFDIFGHPVLVNYEGKTSYSTYLSSFISTIILTLMLLNLIFLSLHFKDDGASAKSSHEDLGRTFFADNLNVVQGVLGVPLIVLVLMLVVEIQLAVFLVVEGADVKNVQRLIDKSHLNLVGFAGVQVLQVERTLGGE